MKTQRHHTIIKLISEHEIETQDELISKLNADGYKVTQATISRDIRELKISKVLGEDGKYYYSLPGKAASIRPCAGITSPAWAYRGWEPCSPRCPTSS